MTPDPPKFKVPFEIVGPRVAVIEQDTLDQIAQCVYVLLSTEVDSRIDYPEYGIPDQAFRKGGVDLEELREVVAEFERRVEDLDFEDEWEGVLQRVKVMIGG